jgi:hypothetical protein
MTSQPATLTKFLEAKADFLTTAREAKATMDGMINGREMEDELVSGGYLLYCITTKFSFT